MSEQDHNRRHQRFSTSTNNNKNTHVTKEEQRRQEPSRMVVFLDEENGFVFSSAFAAPHLRSRSQAATRRVTPTPTSAQEPTTAATGDGGKLMVGKRLPNGDLYSGSFSGNVPHGTGKYLWSDGCMYKGEWRRGKASGKGKFSWPSGATFEGEFKSGRMQGYGTFTGSDGDTYRGSWVEDRRQGCGLKRYVNGDYYEGGWRRNVQEGQGRYVWRNGNQYVGEWKNGVISGRGILIWANGNRYDGHWDHGVPKCGGVFTWPDGSCYVMNSSSPSPQQPFPSSLHGTFYPSTNPCSNIPMKTPLFESAPDTVVHGAKRSSVDVLIGRGSYAGEKHFPRICIWESDGEAGDITCDIMDTIEASMLYRDGIDKVAMESEEQKQQQQQQSERQRSPWCFVGGDEPKKPGHTISKGHKNYDLMRNLQLGISCSIGKSAVTRELRSSDFDPKEKFWTRFPPEGSKITPPHHSTEFRWKDYCPTVFRYLRKLFSVDPADYMLAICGNDALRELSSPGKSGSFFYLTQDDRFMIKTVKKSEVKVLIKMLSAYYRHVSQHQSTLVTKFFGVHCVKPVGGQKVRFVVMGNLFRSSEHRIHRRFDLKGSSYGRTADKSEGEIDETTTLKDLDLNFVFRLEPTRFQHLLRQVELDCKLLEAEGIMDYSLLVGLHFCGGAGLVSKSSSPRISSNMAARAELVSNGGGRHSGDIYEVILYFGIIDILQDYDMSKKLEHAYKSLQVDPASISAVDPKLYSKRFRDFVQRIFVEDR